MTPEEKEEITGDMLRAELEKTKKENAKLGEELKHISAAAEKTNVEIHKLNAEIAQITTPWKTLQFYLSVVTLTVSIVLAVIAGYGVFLQRQKSDAELKEKTQDLATKERELTQKVSDLNTKMSTLDARLTDKNSRLDKLLTDSKGLEEKLGKQKNDLIAADKSTVLSANQAIWHYEDLKRRSDPVNAISDDERRAYANQLNQYLDALGKITPEPFDVVSRLAHPSDDVRLEAALKLSRLAKGVPKAEQKRMELVESILPALRSEKQIDARRLLISAVARVGKEATGPLLRAWTSADEAEFRLNIIRAFGELRTDASPEVIEKLTELLANREVNHVLEKRQAVNALGEIGPTAAAVAEEPIAALLPGNTAGLLDNLDRYYLCRDAVSSLGRIGAKRKDTLARLVPLLDWKDLASDVNRLRQNESRRLADEFRLEAIITIGKFGASAEAAAAKIKTILNAGSVSGAGIMDEAAVALARMGKVEEIAALLSSPARQRQIAGLVALTAVSAREARKTMLRDFLHKEETKKNSDENPERRVSGNFLTPSVIRTIAKRGPNAALVFADALDLVDNPYVRENLVRTIGDLGASCNDVVAALTVELEETNPQRRNPYVQVAAVRTLDKLAVRSDEVRQLILRIAEDSTAAEDRRFDPVKLVAQSALFSQAVCEATFKNQRLSTESKRDKDGKFYNVHTYKFTVGYRYRIDLMSKAFDAFLYLKRGDAVLEFDDDSGGSLNARLIYVPERSEDLDIWATTYHPGAVGDYELEIRRLPKEANR
jgi:hypothetical protein